MTTKRARPRAAIPSIPLPISEQLQRGNLLAADCPSREVLKHVTSRWGVLVLMALEGKTRRFSELRRMIGGVSERMLAQTLQWLEGDGLVDRVAYPVVPPHVEYSLSSLGVEAAARVRTLADWIETSLPEIAERWEKR
ncbi:MAG: winged helix-turn-helix transcriptional regulator [Gemmatimonadaceae bacterium]